MPTRSALRKARHHGEKRELFEHPRPHGGGQIDTHLSSTAGVRCNRAASAHSKYFCTKLLIRRLDRAAVLAEHLTSAAWELMRMHNMQWRQNRWSMTATISLVLLHIATLHDHCSITIKDKQQTNSINANCLSLLMHPHYVARLSLRPPVCTVYLFPLGHPAANASLVRAAVSQLTPLYAVHRIDILCKTMR